jgi:hypothetical protein
LYKLLLYYTSMLKTVAYICQYKVNNVTETETASKVT